MSVLSPLQLSQTELVPGVKDGPKSPLCSVCADREHSENGGPEQEVSDRTYAYDAMHHSLKVFPFAFYLFLSVSSISYQMYRTLTV